MSAPQEAPSDRPTPSERIWQFLTLLAIGSLFGIYGLARLLREAPDLLDAVIVAVQVAPLLAFVPGMLFGSARAAALLSFISVLYFGAGVLAIVDPAQRLTGAAELFFSILLFVASTYYARQRGLRDTAQRG